MGLAQERRCDHCHEVLGNDFISVVLTHYAEPTDEQLRQQGLVPTQIDEGSGAMTFDPVQADALRQHPLPQVHMDLDYCNYEHFAAHAATIEQQNQ